MAMSLRAGIDANHIEPNRNVRLAQQIVVAIENYIEHIADYNDDERCWARSIARLQEQLDIVREYIAKPYGENVWCALAGVHAELTYGPCRVPHPW